MLTSRFRAFAVAQQGTLSIPKLIEATQRVAAGAAEMPVVRSAFLLAMGLADQTVHVQDEVCPAGDVELAYSNEVFTTYLPPTAPNRSV